MNESQLWSLIKTNLPDLDLVRINEGSAEGIADVVFFDSATGKSGWIELKSAPIVDPEKRFSLKITRVQVLFGVERSQAGWPAYALVGVGSGSPLAIMVTRIGKEPKVECDRLLGFHNISGWTANGFRTVHGKMSNLKWKSVHELLTREIHWASL